MPLQNRPMSDLPIRSAKILQPTSRQSIRMPGTAMTKEISTIFNIPLFSKENNPGADSHCLILPSFTVDMLPRGRTNQTNQTGNNGSEYSCRGGQSVSRFGCRLLVAFFLTSSVEISEMAALAPWSKSGSPVVPLPGWSASHATALCWESMFEHQTGCPRYMMGKARTFCVALKKKKKLVTLTHADNPWRPGDVGLNPAADQASCIVYYLSPRACGLQNCLPPFIIRYIRTLSRGGLSNSRQKNLPFQ